MANETRVIIERAHLAAAPQRQTSKNGRTYMQLRFASTPSRRNRQTNQWEDGETEWWTAVEFDERQMDTYMRELHKGDGVRVEGVLTLSTYTDRAGNTQIDRQVSWARITKLLPKAKQAQGGFAGAARPAPQAQESPEAPTGQDPWADPAGSIAEPEF